LRKPRGAPNIRLSTKPALIAATVFNIMQKNPFRFEAGSGPAVLCVKIIITQR
jgi:hypothetical protein